jgi:exodeoxyribonuclease-5
MRALSELQRVDLTQLASTAVAVHKAGGVTICHRNVTRAQLNAGIRWTLGIQDEMPQVGEPLMVLKNAYESGVVNGESFPFEGWTQAPEGYERVFDRYKPVEEDTRFGATTIGKSTVTVSVEELHGRLTAGPRAISIAASKWARMNSVFSGDTQAGHVHTNFGYAWTAHKSQGSQWPYVFVVIEPSVRLDEEEGRRWTYTSLTRASVNAAVYIGRV